MSYYYKYILFYIISLIEHKSDVDYNVVMQILRYMVFIWEDYEKEMEKKQPVISRTKGFQYPPILPIIFYDGIVNWTAATQLKDRIFLSDVLTKYIPDFNCILVQLQNFSNEEIMKKKDTLSIIMLIDKLRNVEEFTDLVNNVNDEYLKVVAVESPKYLLAIMVQIIEAFLSRLNVPYEEVVEFSEQIKERNMGELFKHFQGYDVQATRKEEGEKATIEITEQAIMFLVQSIQEICNSKETAKEQL